MRLRRLLLKFSKSFILFSFYLSYISKTWWRKSEILNIVNSIRNRHFRSFWIILQIICINILSLDARKRMIWKSRKNTVRFNNKRFLIWYGQREDYFKAHITKVKTKLYVFSILTEFKLLNWNRVTTCAYSFFINFFIP